MAAIRCPRCGEWKGRDLFLPRDSAGSRPHTYCRPCHAARSREYRNANLDRVRATERASARRNRRNRKDSYYRYEYGVPYAEYERMLIAHAGRCAICGEPFDPRLCEPALDHCHETGLVRGLLCTFCNHALAGIERDGFVENARAYLGEPNATA